MIDLANGQPNHRLLDLRPLASLRLRERDVEHYFYYSEKRGDLATRRRLVEILGSGSVAAGSTIVTHGALGALELIAKAFRRDIDLMVVASPGYKEAITLFRTLGYQLAALPRTGDGLDVAALQRLVECGRCGVYLVPTLNNPDGWTLTAAEREACARLATEAGSLVIEDDIYQDMLFHGRRLPSILALATRQGTRHRVVRVTSLSKSVLPGARIGLLEAMPVVIDELLAYKFEFGTSPVASYIAHCLLADQAWFQQQLSRLRSQLERRSRMLAAALERYCPEGVWRRPGGGYFLWGELPPGHDAERLLVLAEKHRVRFVPGTAFQLHGSEGCLRLCYSYVAEEELAEGARRLGAAIAAYSKVRNQTAPRNRTTSEPGPRGEEI